MTRAVLVLALAFSGDWTRWGGPGGDFRLEPADVPQAWPSGGVRTLWRRPLGDGYSSILKRGSTLYTMYRSGSREAVVALDAATGKTLWEHGYEAPLFATFDVQYGGGPRATPLLVGDRLFSAGATGLISCLDAGTGKPLWSKSLATDFDATVRNSGYSASMVAWGDTVIFPTGARGAAVVALRQSDGAVVWKRHDYAISYASPVLARIAGRPQVVMLMAEHVLGLDPSNGGLLWSHPHGNGEQVNVAQPVVGDDGIVFLTSAYDGGARALQVTEESGQWRVRELWTHRLMRVHFSNAVRIGDFVYASSGDFGPTPLTAVNVKTGAVLWRDRRFSKSSLLVAGSRLLLLEETGELALAEPHESGLELLGKATVLDGTSWTPPTLDRGRLFLRNRAVVEAMEWASGRLDLP